MRFSQSSLGVFSTTMKEDVVRKIQYVCVYLI